MPLTLYTDGACKGNPGPGGWGVLMIQPGGDVGLFGGEPMTTNNRMEMMAVIKGLEALGEPTDVHVYLDSEYVRKGITEWIRGWKVRGWRTSTGQPVKNADLWRQMDLLVAKHKVTWHWVKGHAGIPGNEAADRLANRGVEEVRAAA